jgi:hypothetical protein
MSETITTSEAALIIRATQYVALYLTPDEGNAIKRLLLSACKRIEKEAEEQEATP